MTVIIRELVVKTTIVEEKKVNGSTAIKLENIDKIIKKKLKRKPNSNYER